MSTGSIHHLDLEDLLAAVDGSLRDEEARAHLASCTVCRNDTERWKVVALGVRHLAAEVAPPATAAFDQSHVQGADSKGSFVLPTVTPHVARHPRRRALIGIAAAVVLVIAGGSYGLTEALGNGGARSASPDTTVASAGLTAVYGCPRLSGVSGTLGQLNSSDLVIDTSDGQSVTISTSPSTRMIGSEGIGTVDDISDGAQVAVNGIDSNGTIAASTVTVGALNKVKPFEPPQPSISPVTVGTVSGAHAGDFSVVKPDGTSVAVTTTTSTTVITLQTLTVHQLQVGGFTLVVGDTPGQGGTLVAGAIEQVPHPISFPRGPTSAKSNRAGCSAENVVTAALMAFR
jgi:hypothetical protein